MPTHTREPWEMRPFHDGEGCSIIVHRGTLVRPIATVWTPDAEGEANRLLITHAARLLAAAQALLTRITEMTSEEFSRGGERAEREALRAIIDQITA